MIIHLKDDVSEAKAAELGVAYRSIYLTDGPRKILVTGCGVKELPAGIESFTKEFFPTTSDIQLAAKTYRPEKRTVDLGPVEIGGNTKNTVMITGPCSVE